MALGWARCLNLGVNANHFDERAATWDDDPAKIERAEVVARNIRAAVSIDGSTFASLLAGIDFTAARRGWHRRPTESARKAIKTIDMDCQV